MRFFRRIEKWFTQHKPQENAEPVHPQQIRQELANYPNANFRRKAMATFLYHYLEHAEHREHIDQAIRDAAVILAQHSAEKASKKLAGKWTGKMTTALLTATKTANEAYREPRHAIYIETSAKHVIELARKEAAAKNANKKIK